MPRVPRSCTSHSLLFRRHELWKKTVVTDFFSSKRSCWTLRLQKPLHFPLLSFLLSHCTKLESWRSFRHVIAWSLFPSKVASRIPWLPCQCFCTGLINSLNTRAVDFNRRGCLWNGIGFTQQAPWGRGLCEQRLSQSVSWKQSQQKKQTLMALGTTHHSINSPGTSFRELHKKGFHHFSSCENLLLSSSPPSFWILDYFSTCVNGPSFIPTLQQSQSLLPFPGSRSFAQVLPKAGSWLRIPVWFWSPGWHSEEHLEHFLKNSLWDGVWIFPQPVALCSVESRFLTKPLQRVTTEDVALLPSQVCGSTAQLDCSWGSAGHGWRLSWPKSSSIITSTSANCFG